MPLLYQRTNIGGSSGCGDLRSQGRSAEPPATDATEDQGPELKKKLIFLNDKKASSKNR